MESPTYFDLDVYMAPPSTDEPIAPPQDPLSHLLHVNSTCGENFETYHVHCSQMSEKNCELQNFQSVFDFSDPNWANWAAQTRQQLADMNAEAIFFREEIHQNIKEGVSAAARTFQVCQQLLLDWQIQQKEAQQAPKSFQSKCRDQLETEIQPKFEEYGRALRELRNHMDSLRMEFEQWGMQGNDPIMVELLKERETIIGMSTSFVQMSCVVLVQPPEVIVKQNLVDNPRGGQYACRPELSLIDGTHLGYRRSDKSWATCYLFREEDAKKFWMEGKPFEQVLPLSLDNQGWELTTYASRRLNSRPEPTFKQEKKNYVARFDALQLTKIPQKRGRENGNQQEHDHVFKQRYYLCFDVFLYGDGVEPMRFQVLSLPFLIASQGKRQMVDMEGDGVIFWVHAAAPGNGVLTQVPKRGVSSAGIPWPQAAQALNRKFQQLLESPKAESPAEISPLALNCLAEKLFGWQKDYSHCILTWDHLFEHVQKHKRHFWDWFTKAAEMVKSNDELMTLWNKKMVFGFTSKRNAEQVLKVEKKPGLLIKFSDSSAGSYYVSYYNPGRDELEHLELIPDPKQKGKFKVTLAETLHLWILQDVHSVYSGWPEEFGKEEMLNELKKVVQGQPTLFPRERRIFQYIQPPSQLAEFN